MEDDNAGVTLAVKSGERRANEQRFFDLGMRWAVGNLPRSI